MKNVKEYVEMLQTLGVEISGVRAKRQELISQHKELEKQINFMTEVLNAVEGNRVREVVKQESGRSKGSKIVAWSLEEHNLIVENLPRLNNEFNSHKELADFLSPHMPQRSTIAIEQRISKTMRGKAKRPKVRKIMAQSKKIVTEKPTFVNEISTPILKPKKNGTWKFWTNDEYMLIKRNIDQVNNYNTIYAFSKALMPYLPGRSHKSIAAYVTKIVRGEVGAPTLARAQQTPKVKKEKTKFVTVSGKPNGKGKRWKPEEVKILIDNAHLSNAQIKKLLPYKRASGSIAQKRWQLKSEGKIPVGVDTPSVSSPSSWSNEGGYMLRKKPLDIVTPETARAEFGSKTTKDYAFPAFSMIPHQSQRYVISTVKDCLMRKGRIDYKDITWIRAIKPWNYTQWNEFITEFIMNAGKIANYFSIANHFTIEKRANEKFIAYKGSAGLKKL